MKHLFYILAVFILLGVSAGLFGSVKILGAAPNLLLVLVLLLGLRKENGDAWWVAVFAGLSLDFYSGVFVGSFALGFLLLIAIARGILSRLAIDGLTVKYLVLAAVLTTAFMDLWVYFYNWIFVSMRRAPAIPLRQLTLPSLAAEILFNIASLYPLYRLVGFLEERVLRLRLRRRSPL